LKNTKEKDDGPESLKVQDILPLADTSAKAQVGYGERNRMFMQINILNLRPLLSNVVAFYFVI